MSGADNSVYWGKVSTPVLRYLNGGWRTWTEIKEWRKTTKITDNLLRNCLAWLSLASLAKFENNKWGASTLSFIMVNKSTSKAKAKIPTKPIAIVKRPSTKKKVRPRKKHQKDK